MHCNKLITTHTHVPYNRSKPTLSGHLWILSKLLLMKDSPSKERPKETNLTKLSDRLLLYVIATSYPKILCCIKHPNLSIPYVTSLEQLKNFQFNESMHSEASKQEIENDQLFLVKYLLTAVEESWLDLPTPKLFQQAKLAKQGDLFKLYTKDTCLEFHLLLSVQWTFSSDMSPHHISPSTLSLSRFWSPLL